jgi:hypothetical protein
MELIQPAYVAWRAGTTTLFLLGSQPPHIAQKFQHSARIQRPIAGVSVPEFSRLKAWPAMVVPVRLGHAAWRAGTSLAHLSP